MVTSEVLPSPPASSTKRVHGQGPRLSSPSAREQPLHVTVTRHAGAGRARTCIWGACRTQAQFRTRRAGSEDREMRRAATQRARGRGGERRRCVSMATSRGVRVRASVLLSRQQAATHLEVSVHNIVLVDMIDTLQDLTNAVTRGSKGDRQTPRSAPSRAKDTIIKTPPPSTPPTPPPPL